MKIQTQYAAAGVQLRLLDPLEKVFPDQEPVASLEYDRIQALRGECASFQVAYSFQGFVREDGRLVPLKAAIVRLDSPLAEHIRLRCVKCVPCSYPAHADADDNYLRKAPGLFPDRLEPLPDDGCVIFTAEQWKALWIDVEAAPELKAGTYPLALRFEDAISGELVASLATEITILPAELPAQTFPHTEWLYVDCLADYYHVPVFSEPHWKILENFIREAVKRGINMILTPHFTPPLDTAVGRERTPAQLVRVRRSAAGEYSFDFSDLVRWFDLCRSCGVRYFEMSHLFSQWGAVAAPNIYGEEDGQVRRLFGWDTPAVGGEYTRFLHAYLPRLRALLHQQGLEGCTCFHISDEPTLQQMGSYRAARESIADVMQGCRFIDAMSDLEFYRQGLVGEPVCASNAIRPFLEQQVPDLWTYYCTAQGADVSNRFFAMPAARTRMLGVQLYKFNIKGFLHWGYNFYNAVDSVFQVDPYRETDCGGGYPGGDAFLVYPGRDGMPEGSIRLMLMGEALTDLRALCCLEQKLGREKVLALIEEGLDQPLTFDEFPRHPEDREYLLRLRAKVDRLLCE